MFNETITQNTIVFYRENIRYSEGVRTNKTFNIVTSVTTELRTVLVLQQL